MGSQDEPSHAHHSSLCKNITDLSFCLGRPGAVEYKLSGVQKDNCCSMSKNRRDDRGAKGRNHEDRPEQG